MDISRLRIGILHSLVGKNDGVSIVIDQTIEAMIEQMNIPLGNVFLLAAHSSHRFNSTLDDVFWHKNEQNKYILKNYSGEAPDGFEEYISKEVLYAKELVEKFVEDNQIDLMIIHNSCHPSNFVYATAVGMYFEELKQDGRLSPKYLLWWHDSHFERERFKEPNPVIQKFLKYIPGSHLDGIVFINTEQEALAKEYFEKHNPLPNMERFFERKTIFIPNTCSIPWNWENTKEEEGGFIPPLDQYNKTFFKDIGLLSALEEKGFELESSVLLLQHTRVVQRKRIDHSIDFAFQLSEKFEKQGEDKCVVLLVSGHSGDEHDSHLLWLHEYFKEKENSFPKIAERVILFFAENYILPEKEVLVEKKFYRFADIPGIVARAGGLGTYFSEVEGYGNNLLEMISYGLPVVINEYPIYKRDIKQLGFDLPSTENGAFSEELLEECYQLLKNPQKRMNLIKHNLKVLQEKLHHGVVAEKLSWVMQNMFRYQ